MMKDKLPRNEDLTWIGTDLDDFIAENSGYPDFHLLGPRQGARVHLYKLVDAGWNIIIDTARPWSHHFMITEWLKDNDIPYHRIICGKPLVRFSMDDKNVPFGTWKEMYEFINNLKP